MVTQLLPLAQRYRPTRFQDVIGQDVFVSVLTKALAQHRVGHGVLLTGMRGIGKTTLARLLAKSLCCLNLESNGEPCLQCASCVAAQTEKHVDIVELDAASHTGIDDMRLILDSCPYQPLMGKHKVYIMDEVHMLSKSAFNALLKTLEEPPPHVTFVFATTELSKVPATIVSRCQQLHLHRIQDRILSDYLVKVAHEEGYTLTPDAGELIAKISQGGVRDALSLLERVCIMSETSSSITALFVEELVGLPSKETIQALIQAMAQKDPDRAIDVLRQLYNAGVDPDLILKELLQSIHAMAQELWQKPKSDDCTLSLLGLEKLDHWWTMGQKAWTDMHTAPFPLLSLEMLLLRMTYVVDLPTPSQLISVIEPLTSAAGQSNAPKPALRPGTVEIDIKEKSLPPKKESVPLNIHTEKPKSTHTIDSLDSLHKLLHRQREVVLQAQINNYVSWVGATADGITLYWDHQRGPMPIGFSAALEQALSKAYGPNTCRVEWGNQSLTKSPIAQEEERQQQQRVMAQNDPTVQSVMEAFPGATIELIEPL